MSRLLPASARAIACTCAALLLAALPAQARSLEGQSFPDAITVDGQKLVLNGIGMRQATVFKVNVYAGALYLPAKSSDGGAILQKDEPWRVHMKFVRDVEAPKLVEAWNEGFSKNGGKGGAALTKLNGWMSDVKEGDAMVFTYVPGKGLEVSVKGKVKGTVGDATFARTFLSIWLGKSPPNAGLKSGMLGK